MVIVATEVDVLHCEDVAGCVERLLPDACVGDDGPGHIIGPRYLRFHYLGHNHRLVSRIVSSTSKDASPKHPSPPPLNYIVDDRSCHLLVHDHQGVVHVMVVLALVVEEDATKSRPCANHSFFEIHPRQEVCTVEEEHIPNCDSGLVMNGDWLFPRLFVPQKILPPKVEAEDPVADLSGENALFVSDRTDQVAPDHLNDPKDASDSLEWGSPWVAPSVVRQPPGDWLLGRSDSFRQDALLVAVVVAFAEPVLLSWLPTVSEGSRMHSTEPRLIMSTIHSQTPPILVPPKNQLNRVAPDEDLEHNHHWARRDWLLSS